MLLVTVRWKDAYATNEMQKPEEVMEGHRPHMVQSAGYLFRDDEVGVTIVRDVDADGAMDGALFIPRGMIESLTSHG